MDLPGLPGLSDPGCHAEAEIEGGEQVPVSTDTLAVSHRGNVTL